MSSSTYRHPHTLRQNESFYVTELNIEKEHKQNKLVLVHIQSVPDSGRSWAFSWRTNFSFCLVLLFLIDPYNC